MKKFNELLAVRATLIFGSMWMTYLFFVYGFMPILIPKDMTTLLYWSNTVQLWSLPLLMVGQNVMGRSSEKRAQQDHETIMAEFRELREMHAEQKASYEQRDAKLERILKLLEHEIRRR